jgi:hypothetical protein
MTGGWTRVRRAATVAVAAITTVGLLATPALAQHQPVHIDEADILPVLGPLVTDGSDPVMLYGTLSSVGGVRAAQLNFQAGETIRLTIGMPNRAPETAIPSGNLPFAVLVAPNYRPTILRPNVRTVTTGADGKSYLVLREYVGTAAVSGTYSLNVSGTVSGRFFVASGDEADTVFNGIQRGAVASQADFTNWYTTP